MEADAPCALVVTNALKIASACPVGTPRPMSLTSIMTLTPPVRQLQPDEVARACHVLHRIDAIPRSVPAVREGDRNGTERKRCEWLRQVEMGECRSFHAMVLTGRRDYHSARRGDVAGARGGTSWCTGERG